MTETKAEEPTKEDQPETTTPEEPKKRTYTKKEPTSTVADLIDIDLVDQETGRDLPLSASTDNLQAVVVSSGGRTLVKVSIRGYIGEEPVVVLAKDVGEFAELVDALEKAAVARRKEASAKKA